jgi:hypothetical protein
MNSDNPAERSAAEERIAELEQLQMRQLVRAGSARDSIVRLRQRLLERRIEVTELEHQVAQLKLDLRLADARTEGRVAGIYEGLAMMVRLGGERGGESNTGMT